MKIISQERPGTGSPCNGSQLDEVFINTENHDRKSEGNIFNGSKLDELLIDRGRFCSLHGREDKPYEDKFKGTDILKQDEVIVQGSMRGEPTPDDEIIFNNSIGSGHSSVVEEDNRPGTANGCKLNEIIVERMYKRNSS